MIKIQNFKYLIHIISFILVAIALFIYNFTDLEILSVVILSIGTIMFITSWLIRENLNLEIVKINEEIDNGRI